MGHQHVSDTLNRRAYTRVDNTLNQFRPVALIAGASKRAGRRAGVVIGESTYYGCWHVLIELNGGRTTWVQRSMLRLIDSVEPW